VPDRNSYGGIGVDTDKARYVFSYYKRLMTEYERLAYRHLALGKTQALFVSWRNIAIALIDPA
jgi:hypothetical protein